MTTLRSTDWSQDLSPRQLQSLQRAGTIYAWTNSLLLEQPSNDTVLAMHIPFCLFPSPFPRDQFEKALRIQTAYNRLYLNIASSPELIKKVLGKSISKVDPFVGRLYELWKKVEDEEKGGRDEHLSLGIFRNDFLLDESETNKPPQIKQVEFNTISVGSCGTGTKILGLHRYMSSLINGANSSRLPAQNPALASSSNALRMAHKHYLSVESPNGLVAILMVVQPKEMNTFDQSLVEYELNSGDDPILVIKVSCHEILKFISIDPATKKIFHTEIGDENLRTEISVVYYRSMYGPQDYLSEDDWNGRYELERSRAINCPDLSMQLAGFKKFQQILTNPVFLQTHQEILMDGIEQSEWEEIQSTWTSIYPLEDPVGYQIATDPQQAVDFVLKPQREGGGNNIFGIEIPKFIETLSDCERQSWILMRLIRPPKSNFNYLMKPSYFNNNNNINHSLSEPTEIVSELGVYGCCLLRRKTCNSVNTSNKVLFNFQSGYLLRTKDLESSEGGVCTGIACLDSPLLV